jgi:hypothetical protein
LTDGVFIPMNEADTVAKLEDTLVKVIKAEHIERKIKKGFKEYQPGYQMLERMLETALSQHIINDDEAKILREAEQARWEVIQVDDFPKDLTKE